MVRYPRSRHGAERMEVEDRLARIEARLAALESRLLPAAAGAGETPPAAVGTPDVAAEPHPPAPAAITQRAAAPRAAKASPKLSTATIMVWGSVASLLLAAGYFVVLTYEWGWLTAPRQLAIAFAAGLALIVGGLWLAEKDRHYAAYLPAVGLAVLYFTVYAGHLYYGLIPIPLAVASVAGISVAGVALGWWFGNNAFTVMAAVGVYLTPILVESSIADTIGIVIYFSVWSLMFSFIALQQGRRAAYLAAIYLALLSFDAAWRISGGNDWQIAASYQLLQFLIFTGTAVLFSIRHRSPMADGEAVLHGLPLFYFYFAEFVLLKEHAPQLVAPLALGSVVVIVVAFLLARARLSGASLAASSSLVSAYCAFVTGHVVFIELLPEAYFTWGVLCLPLVLAMLGRQLDWSARIAGPLALVSGLLFLAGFLMVLLRVDDFAPVALPNLALALYGAVLYGMAFVLRRQQRLASLAAVALYMGHLALMVTTVRLFDSELTISIVWAGYAVGLLLVALKTNERLLGQSSLIIFTASAAKVLLYDLADSAPLVRIGTLVVLGGSLYVGGWLYQSLVRATTELHPNPEIDAQVKLIRELVEHGMGSQEIARTLVDRGVTCLKAGGWTAELIDDIRREFHLG